MIEIEIRGRLSTEDRDRLRTFFEERGEHIESHTREMYILRDYPGYGAFTERAVDIRLRNTDGRCEIMLKKKVNDNHASKQEISLALQDQTLENAKEIVKALGCTNALHMNRKKDIYRYRDIEWSLVDAGKNILYYEAEQVTENPADAPKIQKHLEEEARQLNLQVFTKEQTQEFVNLLDREVNVEVAL